ncbi:hypothetical protein DXG03_005769 [Asterophora parasitica]|uniref:F-box domain-containing protein n=1 Tax=Asterophora parasitica TaxID=117018 RepID=A0A9P7K9R6_9AGAR|nr:hypothetical protein DXG03_005769 [Asterophora parasitica]
MLLNLPPEILVRILCHLDLPDLTSAARVNTLIYSYTKSFQLVQYRFATQAALLEDNPHSTLDVSTKLGVLKDREEGWAKMRFDWWRTVKMEHQASIVDLTGGFFVLSDATRRALHYLKLPSAKDDLLEWSHIEMDHMIIDFGLNVYEHDLIAVVTFINVEIFGDHLALSIASYAEPNRSLDQLYIFDWRMGALKWCVHILSIIILHSSANPRATPGGASTAQSLLRSIRIPLAHATHAQHSHPTIPRVPWTHWGPPSTRWLDTSYVNTDWITTSAGTRVAVSFPAAADDGIGDEVSEVSDDSDSEEDGQVEDEEEGGGDESVEDDEERGLLQVLDLDPYTVRRYLSRGVCEQEQEWEVAGGARGEGGATDVDVVDHQMTLSTYAFSAPVRSATPLVRFMLRKEKRTEEKEGHEQEGGKEKGKEKETEKDHERPWCHFGSVLMDQERLLGLTVGPLTASA